MPLSRSFWSPPGVVGPLAASTRNLHCSWSALSSVMMPPMAAGMSTSQGRVKMVSLLITSPAKLFASYMTSSLVQSFLMTVVVWNLGLGGVAGILEDLLHL